MNLRATALSIAVPLAGCASMIAPLLTKLARLELPGRGAEPVFTLPLGGR